MTENTPSGSVARENQDNLTILRVQGYLSDSLGLEIRNLVEVELLQGKTKILLDLESCSFISSLGISNLFALAIRVIEDFKGRMVLATPKPIMHKVLRLAGVSEMANVVESRQEGLALLRSI